MTDISHKTDFDQWLSKTELKARAEAIATNDRFILAMAKASRSGREKIVPGIYVDPTPPTFAKRYQPEMSVSGSGSPAEMCTRATGSPIGARTLQR